MLNSFPRLHWLSRVKHFELKNTFRFLYLHYCSVPPYCIYIFLNLFIPLPDVMTLQNCMTLTPRCLWLRGVCDSAVSVPHANISSKSSPNSKILIWIRQKYKISLNWPFFENDKMDTAQCTVLYTVQCTPLILNSTPPLHTFVGLYHLGQWAGVRPCRPWQGCVPAVPGAHRVTI